MEDRYYLAAFLQCRQIGSVRMRRLCEAVSSVRDIWSMEAGQLRSLGLLSDTRAEALASHIHAHGDLPERIAADCARQNVELITIDDARYPVILREIFDPPLVLYYRGTLVPDARRIGMVGARKFTAYGEAAAMEFAERIAAAGVTIVSGAARGIDTRAHRGALRGGRTVAVLGCGVDIVYPPENRRLLAQIVETGGAVISEYAPGTQPLPAFFPARNRIISGLSEGTIVVEAAKRSGSLITAECAQEQGKEVYSIPGNITSPGSLGTNKLIRDGAVPLINFDELFEDLGLSKSNKKIDQIFLSKTESRVLEVVKGGSELSIEQIRHIIDIDLAEINAIITILEMKGLIFCEMGKVSIANL